jgi:hypothetical protein
MSQNPEILKVIIEMLMEQATLEPEQSPRRIVAESAKALCVYADMGGALGITPAIEVIHYDFEDEKVSDPNESMKLLALNIAAKRFTELQCLAPVRPRTLSIASSAPELAR